MGANLNLGLDERPVVIQSIQSTRGPIFTIKISCQLSQQAQLSFLMVSTSLNSI